MRIAIDIDSTLHHYWDIFERIVRERHGVEIPYREQMTWGVTRLPPGDVAAAVRTTHEEPHVLGAEPYPGAVEAVTRWHADGHFIHITSHRSTDAHEVTRRWLDRIGLPHDELYCSYDKIARCTEIGIDLLIDDSPVNIERAREREIAAATIEHPWNREVCAREDVICAPDWPELDRRLAVLLDSPQ